ncbi:MAG: UvrD-helicase domain-containing protein, partial [Oscillospiraceae bacterium]|nr:UvrD-helicase domain-containing protein [Oscillospiraceae bacterium]
MSEVFSPTAEQREAIAARGSALLISAGAGSGKTRVLTERLMAYLTDERDPRDADEFLIITYTRAAAGELRGRIISAISDRLRADPKNRRMRRQAVLAHRAEIDTIHSFCGRIARENAHSLSISPAFRIAEESECEAIKTATLERVLEARYENIDRHEGFSLLADTLSPGRDDKKLAELTLEVYTKLRSNVDEQHRAEEQLERLRRAATEDLSKTVWGGFIIEKARRIAEYRLSRAEKTLELLAADGEAYRLFGECFEYARTCARAFLASTEPSADGSAPSDIWDAAEKSAVFEFPRAKPCKKGTFEDIKAEWTRCREGLREIRDLFPADSQGLKEDIAAVYPVTAALFALVRDFAGAYLDEKQRRGIVDFSDLEHFALQLLCDKEGSPTELAREISARYVEIMVDEYQDVSEIQERIFEAVSRGGRNLVTVGDARQSIYRFRLADPSIFLRKYRSFSDAADE